MVKANINSLKLNQKGNIVIMFSSFNNLFINSKTIKIIKNIKIVLLNKNKKIINLIKIYHHL